MPDRLTDERVRDLEMALHGYRKEAEAQRARADAAEAQLASRRGDAVAHSLELVDALTRVAALEARADAALKLAREAVGKLSGVRTKAALRAKLAELETPTTTEET
jgi:hypothetical protein